MTNNTTTAAALSYTFNDKEITLTENDRICIGTGYKSGAYKLRAVYKASEMSRAVLTYDGYNVGRGYKKRLWIVREDGKKETLARVITSCYY